LTVGAADMRGETQEVRVSLRSGLRILLDRQLPLTGELAPGRAFTSAVAAPGLVRAHASFSQLDSYFTTSGLSLVAGRAALVPAGGSPTDTARSAARAGATAVLLYGARLPAGGVPLDEDTPVPVVSIQASVAARLLATIARGQDAGVSIGVAHAVQNAGAPAVAAFSSTGLAYDGRVKPDVVAPGVSIATTEPGAPGGGVTTYGTVNGSSAAAAAVAGAAAVLVEARPLLRATALRSLLVGSARRIPGVSVASEGGGLVSLGGAAAAELAAEPTTLAFGNARSAGWKRSQSVVVRNVSSRPLRVRVRFVPYAQGAAPVEFHAVPSRLVIPRGQIRRVRVAAAVKVAPIGNAPAEGSIVLAPVAGAPLRLPWAVTFEQPADTVLGPLALSTTSFTPSDAGPALLTFRAGQLVSEGARDAVQPISVLTLELLDGSGKQLGVLATLRDLLPGRYAFGLTGRTSAGNALAKGRYRIRVTAVPSLAGRSSSSVVAFTIK
jgi:hypothetical protein